MSYSADLQLNLTATGNPYHAIAASLPETTTVEFAVPTEWPDAARAFAVSEARVGVLGVPGSLPVRWINHPAKDSAANYKFVGVAGQAIYKGLSGGQWHWLAVKAGVPMVEAMADALQRKDD